MNGGAEFGGLSLPLYACHKQVMAFKIQAIVNGPGGWMVHPQDESLPPVVVPFTYLHKRDPRPGGYFVVYRDGYMSHTPAKEFEEGYVLVNELVARRAELERQLEIIDAAIAAQPKG
jgi:hypothetical protein